MELEEVEIISLELKYCERCGGLWLRPAGSDDVYCAPCESSMADLPGAGTGRRKVVGASLQIEGQNGEVVVVVCGKGGNA